MRACKECGGECPPSRKYWQLKFCSTKCRMRAYRRRKRERKEKLKAEFWRRRPVFGVTTVPGAPQIPAVDGVKRNADSQLDKPAVNGHGALPERLVFRRRRHD